MGRSRRRPEAFRALGSEDLAISRFYHRKDASEAGCETIPHRSGSPGTAVSSANFRSDAGPQRSLPAHDLGVQGVGSVTVLQRAIVQVAPPPCRPVRVDDEPQHVRSGASARFLRVLIVCQVCHPPVFGTASGPVTSTPSTSTWNAPPGPGRSHARFERVAAGRRHRTRSISATRRLLT